MNGTELNNNDMCDCIDIELGTYSNTVIVNNVQLDKCIAEEIQGLWALGMKTVASCCGHNKVSPIITISNDYIFHMVLLGYKNQVNPMYPEQTNHFIPKSIKQQ